MFNVLLWVIFILLTFGFGNATHNGPHIHHARQTIPPFGTNCLSDCSLYTTMIGQANCSIACLCSPEAGSALVACYDCTLSLSNAVDPAQLQSALDAFASGCEQGGFFPGNLTVSTGC